MLYEFDDTVGTIAGFNYLITKIQQNPPGDAPDIRIIVYDQDPFSVSRGRCRGWPFGRGRRRAFGGREINKKPGPASHLGSDIDAATMVRNGCQNGSQSQTRGFI